MTQRSQLLKDGACSSTTATVSRSTTSSPAVLPAVWAFSRTTFCSAPSEGTGVWATQTSLPGRPWQLYAQDRARAEWWRQTRGPASWISVTSTEQCRCGRQRVRRRWSRLRRIAAQCYLFASIYLVGTWSLQEGTGLCMFWNFFVFLAFYLFLEKMAILFKIS